MRKIVIFCLALFPFMAWGQMLPTMETMDRRTNIQNKNNSVSLHQYEADVRIFGNIALTTVKLTFYNDGARELEGQLTFPLPDGVSISGFALDINGKMRTAVPVEKELATEVFESIERRNVDPGILEKVEGNNFRTRVYPLPAKGYRTVEVSYQQELAYGTKDKLHYYLPLPTTTLSNFKLKVALSERASVPKLIEKPDGKFVFEKAGSLWTAQIAKENYNPKSSLSIQIPASGNNASSIVQKANDAEEYYFATTVKVPDFPKASLIAPQKVGIVWDNSLSRKAADKSKEKQFLEAYFHWNKNAIVVLSTLNIKLDIPKTIQVKNGDVTELLHWIDNIVYDGGTDLGKMTDLKVDETFLFSDGLSTFGNLGKFGKERVNVVVSNPIADFGSMKYISSSRYGKFIDLNTTSVSDQIKRFQQNDIVIKGIISDDFVVAEGLANIAITGGYVTIIGRTHHRNAQFEVEFLISSATTKRVPVHLAQGEDNGDWSLDVLYAQRRIAALELFYEANKTSIVALGKKYGLVTKGTSLIVLESVEDYIKYEITPPDELLEQYNMAMQAKSNAKSLSYTMLLETAKSTMTSLKDWYTTIYPRKVKEFSVPLRPPSITQAPIQEDVIVSEYSVQGSIEAAPTKVAAPVDAILRNEVSETQKLTTLGDNEQASYIQERPITNLGTVDEGASQAMTTTYSWTGTPPVQSKGSIQIFEQESKAEYMNVFDSSMTVEKAYQLYLKQREKNDKSVSFYFDVANFFYKNYNAEYGTLILSNLAELELENAELYKTIMYVLRKNVQKEKANFIANKILNWRPMDAQSYRDCALTLEDLGRDQDALEMLYQALTRAYTEETLSRDEGIEETILMDINHIISKNKKVDSRFIDDDLKADLPVDIRVVLNWNFDNTDIDLHVTDPKDEVCYYSHKMTKIGGRLSNDFTDGFGPEQFLLKKAIPGKYTIKTNFFGENRVRNLAPTVVFAEIYIRYGTSREERKFVVFESDKYNTSDDLVLIGEFDFL